MHFLSQNYHDKLGNVQEFLFPEFLQSIKNHDIANEKVQTINEFILNALDCY